MAAAVETLTLEELPGLGGRLDRILVGADYTPAFERIKVLLASYTKQNFDEGHAPDGTPWLEPKHRQGKPLRDKGLLMAAATAQGPGHYEQVEKARLEWGVNLDYASVHQDGALVHFEEQSRPHPQKPWVFLDASGETVFTRKIKAHDVLIPARPFLGFSEELVEDIGDVLAEFAAEKAAGG